MLAYDRPIGRTRSETGRPTTQSSPGLNVLELTRLLWRRKTEIAIAGLISGCVAVAIGTSLTPKYSATVQLYLDPRELQLVDRELTPRSQDTSGLAMVVESQARLITSNNVLLQVIQNTNLDKDPEFGGETKSILASLLGLLGFELRSNEGSKLGQTAVLEALNRHVSVKKTDRSFIIDIDVWSRDPEKASMLANAISNAYLKESERSQATAARRATSDLSGRLKELQARLRNAENALAAYKAQNNFVGTQDTLISDQQLSASNQRLAAARALTLDAQAKYDQIEASRRAATDVGAIPEALQSPTIANLRAQYAEARKRYAELTGELGPLHPSLRQIEKQVEDLRRAVNEEVDRFAQSAKNDLTRAREYEASLNNALEGQKRQSVQLSQASVRLRELERDVEASRDVYQAFLKRSRETEEQESLNTSNARVIGEATVPQRRAFPPAASVLAILGFVLGGLGAITWTFTAHRLSTDETGPRPKAVLPPDIEASLQPTAFLRQPETQPRPKPAEASAGKPPIARLQESDVIRTLGGILTTGGVPDVTRKGWPTLRSGFPPTTFLNSVRDIRAALAQRSPGKAMPVLALIGAGNYEDRSVAALNVALAAARDGANVLMIDADHIRHSLSDKVNGLGKNEPSRLGWLSIGTRACRAIKTSNGISILPANHGSKTCAAIGEAIAHARSAGGYDLVILDGPVMPWNAANRKLLDIADGLIAILPLGLDVNDSMENIITALGGAEQKLVGVVLNELKPLAGSDQRDRQYA